MRRESEDTILPIAPRATILEERDSLVRGEGHFLLEKVFAHKGILRIA